MDALCVLSIYIDTERFTLVPKPCLKVQKMFHRIVGDSITCYSDADNFARAMPDEFKYDTNIDTFTAYKMYVKQLKPWVASNYLRDQSRKPNWV